jgi:hypothetical protein
MMQTCTGVLLVDQHMPTLEEEKLLWDAGRTTEAKIT